MVILGEKWRGTEGGGRRRGKMVASFVARAPFNYKLTALIRKLASSRAASYFRVNRRRAFSPLPLPPPLPLFLFSRHRTLVAMVLSSSTQHSRVYGTASFIATLLAETCQLILLKRPPRPLRLLLFLLSLFFYFSRIDLRSRHARNFCA